eukprot:6313390-Amphidinium_carterae.2
MRSFRPSQILPRTLDCHRGVETRLCVKEEAGTESSWIERRLIGLAAVLCATFLSGRTQAKSGTACPQPPNPQDEAELQDGVNVTAGPNCNVATF